MHKNAFIQKIYDKLINKVSLFKSGYLKLKRKKLYDNLLVIFLYIVLSVFVLSANFFKGETVGPFNFLVSFPGWSSLNYHPVVVDTERMDALDGSIPEQINYKNNLLSGKIPVLDLFYSGKIFIPSYIVTIFVGTIPVGLYFSEILKLVVCGFGVFLLLSLFTRKSAAFFGGVVYMLCGFNASWFIGAHVDVSMWIPWLLWATAGYLIEEKKYYLLFITASTVFMLSGYFPSVAAYGFYCFGILLLFWNLTDYKSIKSFIIKLSMPSLFIVLGFLIAMPTLSSYANLIAGLNPQTTGVDLSWRHGGTKLSVNDLYLFVRPFRNIKVETCVYTGIFSLLLAALSVPVMIFMRNKKIRHFTIFGFIIFILSVLIGFGMIPYEIVRNIPTFSFNRAQRLTSIIGLSLAILSGIGFEGMLSIPDFPFYPSFIENWIKKNRIRLKTFVLIFAAFIFIFQIFDQKRIFSHFNAVEPSEWCYPETRSIKYLKEHLSPFQNIIADNSFLHCGVMGGYGLNEIFLHRYYTRNEKDLLRRIVPNGFTSPTSASFPAEAINYDSNLFHALGIKFIIRGKFNKIILQEQPANSIMVPSEPLPASKIVQYVNLKEDIKNLDGIMTEFGTYNEPYAPEDVKLVLKNSFGVIIEEIVVGKEKIENNKWAYFDFKKRLTLAKGIYKFEIHLYGKNYGGIFAIWKTSQPADEKSYLEENGRKTDFALMYKLYTTKKEDSNGWIVHKVESGIRVWEKPDTPTGAYYIPDLNEKPENINIKNCGGVTEERVDAYKIRINYNKDAGGFIVLPDWCRDGWKAYINGKEINTEKYLKFLPAFHVPGKTEIIYKFQYSMIIIWLSFAGLLIFIGILFLFMMIKHENPHYFKQNN